MIDVMACLPSAIYQVGLLLVGFEVGLVFFSFYSILEVVFSDGTRSQGGDDES